MARIAGVDLPNNKRIEIGLTYIYGIGISRSQEILNKLNISTDTLINELTDEQIISIRNILNNEYQLEGAIRSTNAGRVALSRNTLKYRISSLQQCSC